MQRNDSPWSCYLDGFFFGQLDCLFHLSSNLIVFLFKFMQFLIDLSLSCLKSAFSSMSSLQVPFQNFDPLIKISINLLMNEGIPISINIANITFWVKLNPRNLHPNFRNLTKQFILIILHHLFIQSMKLMLHFLIHCGFQFIGWVPISWSFLSEPAEHRFPFQRRLKLVL